MPKARGTKAKYRINAFETIKEKALIQTHTQQLNINTVSSRLGNKIIVLNQISKSYNQRKIIQNFSYQFVRNEKIGIIGNNGCGKSTLLNIISGIIKLDEGTVEMGATVKMGYFKQEGIQFDNNLRVIDAAKRIAEIVTLPNGKTISVSDFLNSFMFNFEAQHTPIYKLSGGEKRRLYLATILMTNPNFLLLDETTNDLDIETINVLEDYLQNFQGCVVIVSHDRFFIDKVVDHIFVLDGNANIKDFPGNYSDYLNYLKKLPKASEHLPRKSKILANEKTETQTNAKPKISYKEQKEFETLTNEIEILENLKKQLEEALNSGTLSNNEIILKSKQLHEIILQLEKKSERWLELSIIYNL